MLRVTTKEGGREEYMCVYVCGWSWASTSRHSVDECGGLELTPPAPDWGLDPLEVLFSGKCGSQ